MTMCEEESATNIDPRPYFLRAFASFRGNYAGVNSGRTTDIVTRPSNSVKRLEEGGRGCREQREIKKNRKTEGASGGTKAAEDETSGNFHSGARQREALRG